jgi:WD40 repeat protein
MSRRQGEERLVSDRYIVSLQQANGCDEDFLRRTLQQNASQPRSINGGSDGNNNNIQSSTTTTTMRKPFGLDYDQVLKESLNIKQLRFQANGFTSQSAASSRTPSASPLDRYIASRQEEIEVEPSSILDAPGLRDDFYLNILDWSARDQLAVALEDTVYVWDEATGAVRAVCQVDDRTDYVASVAFDTAGDRLVCGNSLGCLTVSDLATERRVQDYHIRECGRVATIAVSPAGASLGDPCLTVGTRTGKIFHFDPRDSQRPAAIMAGHALEVCGLRRGFDGVSIASGGNDNQVCVWDLRSPREALWTQGDHDAAVKALAWSPWHPHVLATGGGTADRRIRFWNTQTNVCTRSIQTDSQVCGLLWSKTASELVSTHGFSGNELVVWHHPSLRRVAGMRAHDSRVLHSVMSRDGARVVTAAANEHLKFWNLFPPTGESPDR